MNIIFCLLSFFTINKLFFYIYFKYIPTDIIRRYFTESCNTITSHAIITDGIAVGNSVGTCRLNFRRIYSVGNVPAGNFFLARAYPSVLPSVFPSVGGFFICDRISDGNGIYRRLLYRRTGSVGDSVGIIFTDGFHCCHRRNESIGKTG